MSAVHASQFRNRKETRWKQSPGLALGALVSKLVTVIKSFGKDNNIVFTQIVVWLAGFVVAWVASQSNLGGGIVFSGMALKDMNIADLLLAGTALGSSFSVVYDFKKARDNSDNAAEPALIPSLSNKAGA